MQVRPLFEQGELEKNMIHGEALALRAFIHFEICFECSLLL